MGFPVGSGGEKEKWDQWLKTEVKQDDRLYRRF
jgi:hypothetical protein